ncbi:cyclohexadienyl dehydratase [Mycobacteroides stephanolepidis]|uniref:Cyclohexadienyl dehydratase n=1 Tax=[Mycobacterium] stephanolepidis TaxID=1520670 RepID=A0A1Z4F1L2_9MYCO|nr:cyclohexadienyl dehydratase [[Mycobacterium] stephanolepidis]
MFIATTWGTLMKDMAAPGKCDIAMGGISRTPAREQFADFTLPYLVSGKMPLTRYGNAERLQSIEQINRPGIRVIENSGGTNEEFARRNFPKATLTIWPDNMTVFDQLLQDNADVMITDAIEALYQAKQHPELVAGYSGKPFTVDYKAYMLPKGSPLIEQTNQWLAEALTNGTFSRLLSKWLR